MVKSGEVATVACVAVVLAACGTSGTDTRLADAGATTSTVAAVTTTAPAATETTAAPVAAETTAVPETTTTTVPLDEQLAGDWFACEFVEAPGTPPTDDCAMFDDDGLGFMADGTLEAIELTGGEERACLFGNPGRCFPADTEAALIGVEMIGTWTLKGTTIAVAVDGCEGTVEWEQGETHSIFRPGEKNGCEVLEIDSNASEQAQAGGVYFGKYDP